MNDMADVLEDHPEPEIDGGYYYCRCGHDYGVIASNAAVAAHQSAALSAAGFGLVADAKAEGAAAAIAYLREGMESWAEPRVLGFLEGAQSVSADIAGNS